MIIVDINEEDKLLAIERLNEIYSLIDNLNDKQTVLFEQLSNSLMIDDEVIGSEFLSDIIKQNTLMQESIQNDIVEKIQNNI